MAGTDAGDPARAGWSIRAHLGTTRCDSHLYWAHGKTALDVDNGPTTISSMALLGRSKSVLASGLGHILNMQARGTSIYLAVEPDLLQVVDTETGGLRTIGQTPPGLFKVELGEKAIYALSVLHGIISYAD